MPFTLLILADVVLVVLLGELSVFFWPLLRPSAASMIFEVFVRCAWISEDYFLDRAWKLCFYDDCNLVRQQRTGLRLLLLITNLVCVAVLTAAACLKNKVFPSQFCFRCKQSGTNCWMFVLH